MDSRMNTISVMEGNRQVMPAEVMMNYVVMLIEWLKSFVKRAGDVLNTESRATVIVAGFVTFFAFALGAFSLGSIAGIIFLLAIRPFVD